MATVKLIIAPGGVGCNHVLIEIEGLNGKQKTRRIATTRERLVSKNFIDEGYTQEERIILAKISDKIALSSKTSAEDLKADLEKVTL